MHGLLEFAVAILGIRAICVTASPVRSSSTGAETIHYPRQALQSLENGLIFTSGFAFQRTRIQNLQGWNDAEGGEVPPVGLVNTAQNDAEHSIESAADGSNGARTAHGTFTIGGVRFWFRISGNAASNTNAAGVIQGVGADVLATMIADAIQSLAANNESDISWDLVDADDGEVVGTLAMGCI
ncbi:hypothetical protein BGZ63DRAFT_399535 [Mariannaea sp. PMI_226]|nr:hypothetical protein BGZ63DRAFT_399535 [Mariannaea sp. PMI_226]